MEFSILIPVYKAEAFLPAALDSALAQSFRDYEIVAAEDGSPDGCGAILDRYAAAYPDRLRVLHLPHQGTIPTRRSLIEAARGEISVWLDADDLMAPDALQTFRDAFSADPELDAFLYEYTFFYDDDGREVSRPALFADGSRFAGNEGKKPIYELLIRGSLLDSLCIKAMRTELLKADPSDYGPVAANPYGEDVLHSLYPLTKARAIRYTTRSFYRYRMHNDSVMHAFSAAGLNKRFNEGKFAFFAPFMKVWGLDDAEHQTLLKASSYKTVVDGVLYFIEAGYDKKDIRAYVRQFNADHPELKKIARSKVLSLKLRTILLLFSLKMPYLIEAVYKLIRLIRR